MPSQQSNSNGMMQTVPIEVHNILMRKFQLQRVIRNSGQRSHFFNFMSEVQSFEDVHHHHFCINDTEFSIATSGELIGNTGKLIWDATLVLMEALNKEVTLNTGEKFNFKDAITDKVVVELGCGTGILGVA